MSQAAPYTAQRLTVDGIAIVRLSDAARKMEVSVAPSLGNKAYEMKIGGASILYTPYRTLGELAAKPAMAGNPFLAPWANRIDQDAYWANGKKYLLNPDLGNLRYDGNHKPIHGLLVYAKDWKVVAAQADEHAAWVTSRLEFWRHPEWMAQFPFAHTIEMTYRLADGMLEVRTSIENLSNEPMPLVIGFHTYYQLPGVPRDSWEVHVAAQEHVELSSILTPTGERKPVHLPDPLTLKGTQLDDVFTGLKRDSDQRAEFWVKGGGRKISVLYGRQYIVAVVYAPPGHDFICFEPMTGVTNGFNLAHEGKYGELQSIAPHQTWAESFWIKPSGF